MRRIKRRQMFDLRPADVEQTDQMQAPRTVHAFSTSKATGRLRIALQHVSWKPVRSLARLEKKLASRSRSVHQWLFQGACPLLLSLTPFDTSKGETKVVSCTGFSIGFSPGFSICTFSICTVYDGEERPLQSIPFRVLLRLNVRLHTSHK